MLAFMDHCVMFSFLVQVGTNGYLSFDKVFTDYVTFEFPGDGHVTLVAPFFSDIDISKGIGSITYEVHTPKYSETLFSDINAVINDQMKTNFTGSWLIVAEWKNVPEFGGSIYTVRFLLSTYIVYMLYCKSEYIAFSLAE